MTRATAVPETVTIHVPFRIVKRGGRKEMQLPEGAPRFPVTDHSQVVLGTKAAPVIEGLVKTSAAWLIDKAGFGKGYKMPGGEPYHPAGFMTFVGASAMVNGKTMGVYPAAKALLSAVYEGSLVDFDSALRIEARWFTNVLLNPSSSAMIRSLFLSKQDLDKGALRPAGVSRLPISTRSGFSRS